MAETKWPGGVCHRFILDQLILLVSNTPLFRVQPKKVQVSGGSVRAHLLAQRRMPSAAPPTQPGSRICHGRSTATLHSCQLRIEEENPGVYDPGSQWLGGRRGTGSCSDRETTVLYS